MYQSFPQTVYTKKENAMPQIPKSREEPKEKNPLQSLLKQLEWDDLLLIGILILLLHEDSDDWVLIALLAVLLLC